MGADFSTRSPRSFVYSPAYGEAMADSNNILTESPKSQHHWIVMIAFLAPFMFVTLGCWVWSLQIQNNLLKHRNDELHEMIQDVLNVRRNHHCSFQNIDPSECGRRSAAGPYIRPILCCSAFSNAIVPFSRSTRL